MRIAIWPAYCCLLILMKVASVWSKTAAEFLSEGKNFLATKEYDSAINAYSEAIALEPGNYMNFFQRATAYLAVGAMRNALGDIAKVVELRPGFTHAILQQADLQTKLGLLEDAEQTLSGVKDNAEAAEQLRIVRDARSYREQGMLHADARNYEMAVEHFNVVMEHVTHDEKVRMARANALLALGRRGDAINDVAYVRTEASRRAVRLTNDNTEGYLLLSKLYHENGQADKSLNEIRECLRLDPDHKPCFSHYKSIKKLHKAIESAEKAINEDRYADAAQRFVKLLDQTTGIPNYQADFSRRLCTSYLKTEDAAKAVMYCTKATELIEDDDDLLCDRAEAHILNGEYDQAANDYNKILQDNQNHQRARDGQQRAEQLKRQAKKRDYYKVLGVKRTANKKEILKAYRRLALEWHPDKHASTPEEKEMAEKRFMDISDAKEVLTDEEKRKQFDQGIDPLDSEQQQQRHHHNPFGDFHGFHGFPGGGGGGQQFHFRWG